jgi:arylsulfatase A-like enzyme
MPTLLDVMGLDNGGTEVDGQSMAGLLETGAGHSASATAPEAYAETVWESHEPDDPGVNSCLAALRAPPWKLVWNRLTGTHQLYNVVEDPAETTDLFQQRAGVVDAMAERLVGLAGEMPALDQAAASSVLVDRLRGLGYL